MSCRSAPRTFWTHEENGRGHGAYGARCHDVPEVYQGNVMTALGARKAHPDEYADDEQPFPH